MIDRLMKNAETLLEQAKTLGADEAEVKASHQVSARVTWEKGDFSISTRNTVSGLALKVHKDKRKGTASTNEEGEAPLRASAERALTLASFALPDDYLCLPGAQSPVDLPGRFDQGLAELSATEHHDLAAAMIAAAAEEPRLSLDGGHVEVAVDHAVIVNSEGLSASEANTQIVYVLMGMGKTESEVTSFDYLYGVEWAKGGVGERSQAMARELGERVVACLGPRKGESYKGAVLLSPATMGQLLISPMQFHMSGRQIMDGKSRWDKSLDELVASEKLSVTDNPFNLALSSATPHDAEGVSVRARPVIENGVLRLHMDSTYSASRRGTASTGHAGGLHGVEIAAGDKSREELLGMAEQLVVVDRFSGNLDPVTGDFSGVAKCSHYYKGGQHQHPLTETMIAGNFFEMIRNIVAISDKSEPWCNSHQAPWLLVDGISVTAG